MTTSARERGGPRLAAWAASCLWPSISKAPSVASVASDPGAIALPPLPIPSRPDASPPNGSGSGFADLLETNTPVAASPPPHAPPPATPAARPDAPLPSVRSARDAPIADSPPDAPARPDDQGQPAAANNAAPDGKARNKAPANPTHTGNAKNVPAAADTSSAATTQPAPDAGAANQIASITAALVAGQSAIPSGDPAPADGGDDKAAIDSNAKPGKGTGRTAADASAAPVDPT